MSISVHDMHVHALSLLSATHKFDWDNRILETYRHKVGDLDIHVVFRIRSVENGNRELEKHTAIHVVF